MPPWLRLGVEVWDLPAGRREDHLVAGHETLARIAVLTGVPGASDARSAMGTDEPRFATAVARAALRDDASAGTALDAANRALFDPSRTGHRTQASVTAIVATVTRHGTEILAAGAAGAYALRDGDWFALVPGTPLTSDGEALLRGWSMEHPEATADERAEAVVRLVDDPALWRNPAAGSFARLSPDVVTIDNDWEELVLASEGARLDPSLLGRLEGWIAGLRAWEAQHAVALGRGGAPVHDDVTVIRVRRLPASADGEQAPGELGDGR
ncbi:MAG: hypothetical protein WCK58_04720 [Chloroflexota bacterium]